MTCLFYNINIAYAYIIGLRWSLKAHFKIIKMATFLKIAILLFSKKAELFFIFLLSLFVYFFYLIHKLIHTFIRICPVGIYQRTF